MEASNKFGAMLLPVVSSDYVVLVTGCSIFKRLNACCCNTLPIVIQSASLYSLDLVQALPASCSTVCCPN